MPRKRKPSLKLGKDSEELLIKILREFKEATSGGTDNFLKKFDDLLDNFLNAIKTNISKSDFLRLLNRVRKGTLRRMGPGDSGIFLKKRPKVNAELYDLPLNTRGTGGVLEGRGLRFPDRSVEVELGGKIQPSISPLRNPKDYDINHKALDYSKELRSGSKLSYGDVSLDNYDRAHLWGHGFGDEARAGIMYAPAEFNRVWQNLHLEDKIRASAAALEGTGRSLTLRAKARSFPPKPNVRTKASSKGGQPLNAKKHEHVLSNVSYEVGIIEPNGEISWITRVDFDIPPPGSNTPIPHPTVTGIDLLESLERQVR